VHRGFVRNLIKEEVQAAVKTEVEAQIGGYISVPLADQVKASKKQLKQVKQFADNTCVTSLYMCVRAVVDRVR
jgi:hypothetical protein